MSISSTQHTTHIHTLVKGEGIEKKKEKPPKKRELKPARVQEFISLRIFRTLNINDVPLFTQILPYLSK